MWIAERLCEPERIRTSHETLIERTKNKVRMIWDFDEYHWEQLEELAKKLKFDNADEMFQDVTLGFLQRNGVDPMKWI